MNGDERAIPVAPKGEVLWTSFWVRGECRYIITSKPARDVYYLYSYSSGKLKKVAKGSSPVELEEKHLKGWDSK